MPTEPAPITLADLARRAVQICDPQDSDAVLGDYLVQFEDADEPVTAIQNLEERVALAAEDAGMRRFAAAGAGRVPRGDA